MKKHVCKRILAMLLALMLVTANVPMPIYAVEADDDDDDAYIEIRTVEDLYFIRNNLSANYILMNDIDLTEATKKGGTWDYMGNGWDPIGSGNTYAGNAFSGIFDGNGYTIKGLRIDVTTTPSGVSDTRYVGLFASVSGTVKNLTVEGGVSSDFGGKTCYVGGIAGYCSGTMTNCVNKATVYGKPASDSSSYTVYAGGIVGHASSAAISRCVNIGSVSTYSYASYGYAGGICGSGSGTISISYNTGAITATTCGYYQSGYYSGYAYASGISYSGTITDCYNTGAVASKSGSSSYTYTYTRAYGIGGTTTTNCYNVGQVSANDGKYAIGTSTNKKCYFLSGTGSQTTGTVPLTAEQAKIQQMYAGFNFDSTWLINPYAAYPYPQLRDNVQNLDEGATFVSVISWPLKTEYLTGDELVLDGAMINVVYTSGTSEYLSVTEDMISGFDNTKVGEQTVTVTYRGQSDSFPVTVTERPQVTEITMVTLPATTEFRVGSAFDFSGAQIKVSYSDGTMKIISVTDDMLSGGNIHRIGKHTITVTYYGQTTTFEVTVVGISLSSLRLASLPDKLTYLEGEELDLTGMTLHTVMNNGAESAVSSGYTVSGYTGKPGTQTITIGYMGKSVSFTVTVTAKTLTSLVLEKAPTRKEYIAGESFDDTGMKLVATYDNGNVETVTDYQISGFDSTPGTKTVVLSVGGKSVSFAVTVIPREITDLRITAYPYKLSYMQFEELDLTGLEVTVTYNDGTMEAVQDYQVAGFSSEIGTHTISVAYGGFVKTFDVVVSAKTLTKLVVTTPDRLTYYIGESFDATGMVVTAVYSNGQTSVVEGYEISGFDSTTAGIKTVTVTYDGMSRSFEVSVTKRNQVDLGGGFVVGTAVGRPTEEIRVKVSVNGNPGLAGLRHDISFDNAKLTFVGAEAKGAFASGTVVANAQQADSGKATVLWYSSTNVAGDGVVYELIFKVKKAASEGTVSIGIDFNENDNANLAGENIIFDKQNGSVEICDYWLGDLSGDNKYAMVDLVMLAQYVAGYELQFTPKQLLSADVNEDGIIDIHDVVLLNQWLLTEDF